MSETNIPTTPLEAPTAAPRKFAGADWLVQTLPKDMKMSELGTAVADLLGDLYLGIYHLPIGQLRKADWTSTHSISLVVDGKVDWSTYDSDMLTRLVLLAHDRCIRASIEAVNFRYIRLVFFPRQREGRIFFRHPTLEDHIVGLRGVYGGSR